MGRGRVHALKAAPSSSASIRPDPSSSISSKHIRRSRLCCFVSFGLTSCTHQDGASITLSPTRSKVMSPGPQHWSSHLAMLTQPHSNSHCQPGINLICGSAAAQRNQAGFETPFSVLGQHHAGSWWSVAKPLLDDQSVLLLSLKGSCAQTRISRTDCFCNCSFVWLASRAIGDLV